MKKKKYTVAIHVKRLKRMLKMGGSLEERCPGAPELSAYNSRSELWSDTSNPCHVCRGFVGMVHNMLLCPCHFLGEREAMEVTVRGIKEYEESFPPRRKK